MGDTKPVLAIAIVHLVSSMVLAAGGLLHSLLLPGNLEDSDIARARKFNIEWDNPCLLYTSPSPRDATLSRMPSSA